jgi:CHASE3 domain sensor protein
MTIRSKLYAAIVVTVAGVALTVGVAIWAMSRLGDRFDEVRRTGDARALALQLKFGVTDFNGWQTAYGYDGGASRGRFLSSVADFRATLEQARAELTSPVERRLLSRIGAAFSDFMRLDARAFGALSAGRTQEVRRLFLGPEITNFERAASAAEALAETESARAAAADRAFKDDRTDAIRLLIAAGIVAALLVALLLITALDLARAAEGALPRKRP